MPRTVNPATAYRLVPPCHARPCLRQRPVHRCREGREERQEAQALRGA